MSEVRSHGWPDEEKYSDMPVENGPDFICIGMPKAGTGWLYDQLEHHPDFWMPPAKEISYLGRKAPKLENVRRLLRNSTDNPDKMEKRFKWRRRWDDRDTAFLDYAASLAGRPADLDSYAAMFQFKGRLLTGDITPGYSAMKERRIAEVGRRMPDTRIVFLIRDPVSRAWSQISMAHRRRKFETQVVENTDKFRAFLERFRPTRRLSYPSPIAERWDRVAPKVRLQHFFFDDIVSRPGEVRRDILAFIGADPDKSSGDVDPGHNRKAKAAKLVLREDIKAVLAEFYAEELRACAARFGGHAKTWAANYGVA